MRGIGTSRFIGFAALSAALLLAAPGQSAMAVPGTITVYSAVCYDTDAGDVDGPSVGIVDLGGDDMYFLYADARGNPGDWALISPQPDALAKFRRGRLEFDVDYGYSDPVKVRGTITRNGLLLTSGSSSASPKTPLRMRKVKLPEFWTACR